MKTPTQEQFQTVIDNLIEAQNIAKGNAIVDMMQEQVETSKKHICGTPMCHGGWYAVVKFKGKKKDKAGFAIDFSDGATNMANDLGFEFDENLSEWAHLNPEIWGNDYGDRMFCGGEAFGEINDSGFTLQTIIDHWKGVKERAAQLSN